MFECASDSGLLVPENTEICLAIEFSRIKAQIYRFNLN